MAAVPKRTERAERPRPIRLSGRRDSLVRAVYEYREPVSETDRHEQLMVLLVIEDVRLPLTVGRGVLAQVHRHVDDRAAGGPDQLRLTRGGLEVDAAQRSLFRPRVVLLDEVDIDPEPCPLAAGVGLEHEPALVAVHLRFDEDDPVELRLPRGRH